MYNLTKLVTATSLFDLADFVHTVFPPFFVLLMLAVWIVVTAMGSYYGFPQGGLIASFVCAVLCIPLVVAGLLSLYTAFGFWLLTGLLSFVIILIRKE
jgi:hypothetical protein